LAVSERDETEVAGVWIDSMSDETVQDAGVDGVDDEDMERTVCGDVVRGDNGLSR
jgi:hypothetical protein